MLLTASRLDDRTEESRETVSREVVAGQRRRRSGFQTTSAVSCRTGTRSRR
ncbi:hypothetical protein SAMN04487819_11857 [Actinopolyspora alba]|uniref:Uncharacterized protein n=1 Tax=Actinopolyspora alba TaxID=673379 RepID=A0A1I2C0N9_9ACTN|nr:hypothetical protein SAMN04487819_11857 [Actinopolyspora alba]